MPRTRRHRPGGDDLPEVFSGALIVRGTGLAEVTATGVQSEIGKIGQALRALETEPPRLQAADRRLVRLFALVGVAVSVLAVLLYGTHARRMAGRRYWPASRSACRCCRRSCPSC